ncbi:hemolysin-III related-domain-containing protein [Obelidium mucronatum]|nr:hemolysin-III related-domain-containing protein [Obelidium mucronatum]
MGDLDHQTDDGTISPVSHSKFHSTGARRQHTPLRFRFGLAWTKTKLSPNDDLDASTHLRQDDHAPPHLNPSQSLLTETDMPAWYQHTPYILTGYRRICHSFAACVESLFYVHNETGNFYTHAFGAFFFIILEIYTRYFILIPNDAEWSDYVVFAGFHLSAVFCLTMSASFHLFCCHSQRVQRNCMKCDYVGIVVLIVGSMLATMYYGFYCYTGMQVVYMTMVSLAGIITIGVNASEYFVGPKYRALRTMLFISIPTLGVIPIIHSILALDEDWSTLFRMVSAPYNLLMISSYLFGALLFLFHVPECFYPGYFDYWFQSHQIFHVFVLLGAIFHHLGLVDVFLWRKLEGGSTMACSPPSLS